MSEPIDIIDGWAIVGNHIHHGPLREGARCYLSHWSLLDTAEVLVAPKGRKWARFWTRIWRLNDLRVTRECAPRGSKLGLLLRTGDEGKAYQDATLARLLEIREEEINKRAAHV